MSGVITNGEYPGLVLDHRHDGNGPRVVAADSSTLMPCRKHHTLPRRSRPGVSGVQRRAGGARLRRAVRRHLELFSTMPEFQAFFDQLATFCRSSCSTRPGSGCRTRSRTFAP